ncbi:hypothetical protein FH972_001636 [Carpinus fangiana]|uniref:Chromo domain-containing protein n=1 Tax=Carpinus fangiana TaxID=176857 RepID=A0A5N6QFN1_9ROSI|nr:hypothetical protein FH972_001636 [Carpinus fangiana]
MMKGLPFSSLPTWAITFVSSALAFPSFRSVRTVGHVQLYNRLSVSLRFCMFARLQEVSYALPSFAVGTRRRLNFLQLERSVGAALPSLTALAEWRLGKRLVCPGNASSQAPSLLLILSGTDATSTKVLSGQELNTRLPTPLKPTRLKKMPTLDADVSSEVEDIPHNAGQAVDEAEDEDDDSEQGEDEYVVEKIGSHKFIKGKVYYEVFWAGYADPTWEPRDNLDGCPDQVKEYHQEIGGTPEPTKKKAGRKSGADSDTPSKKRKLSADTPEPKPARGRPKKGKQIDDDEGNLDIVSSEDGIKFKAPSGSWDSNIIRVTGVAERSGDNGERFLDAYILWDAQYKNRRSVHRTKVLFTKAPCRLLEFYEAHLHFNEMVPETKAISSNGGMAHDNEDMDEDLGIKDVATG